MWDLHGSLVPRKKEAEEKSFLYAFCYVSIIHTKIVDYFEMFQKSKLHALKSTSSTEFFILKMVNLPLEIYGPLLLKCTCHATKEPLLIIKNSIIENTHGRMGPHFSIQKAETSQFLFISCQESYFDILNKTQ